MPADDKSSILGRRAAIVMAVTGVLWIAITWLGGALEWSHRFRALFDLAALAGFGFALWLVYQAFKARSHD